jgi:hypothetical protein
VNGLEGRRQELWRSHRREEHPKKKKIERESGSPQESVD